MKKRINKLLMISLCLFLLIPCINVKADSAQKYLALGADLTESQKNKVLGMLGVTNIEDYEVITVTNQEEHEYLDGKIASHIIGSRALSCASVELSKESGIDVLTQNITYCSAGMYQNALVTAGVENALVKVAGPFEISGTAALVGIIKAYENVSGKEISQDNKDTATQELVTTGEISEKIGAENAEKLIADVKQKVVEDKITNKEDILNAIEESAENLKISLSDHDKQKIQKLMDKISSLDLSVDKLKEQVKSIYDKLKSNEGLWNKIKSWFNKAKKWLKELLQ